MDAGLVAAAAARHWVVTTGELLALGFGEKQIAMRVKRGALHRRHRGVYAVGRPELSFEGACLAAVLACGPRSAISHLTAARLWGFRRNGGAIHVTAPRGREGHHGLCVHRPRSLSGDDITERKGVAVTTVARTLLDLAATDSPDRLGWAMHEATVQGVFDAREVWAVLGRAKHHRGAGRLEAALGAEFAPTRSGLERAFRAICRRARVPTPLVNRHVLSVDRLEEVDFHWPQLGLVVETDGGRYHSTRWRRRKDAAKTARLEAAGWRVRRFAELDIELDPSGVAAELRRLASLGRSNRPRAPV